MTTPDLTLSPTLTQGHTQMWSPGTTYQPYMVVVDRGGLWMALTQNKNSQPISGNPDWTLVAGTPYVDVTLTPPDIISPLYQDPHQAITGVNQGTKTFTTNSYYAPFPTGTRIRVILAFSGNNGIYTVASATTTHITVVEAIPDNTVEGFIIGPGTQLIPAPGAGLISYPVFATTVTSDGDDWLTSAEAVVQIGFENAAPVGVTNDMLGGLSGSDPFTLAMATNMTTPETFTSSAGGASNQPVTIATTNDLGNVGTRSISYRMYYTIEPTTKTFVNAFYNITAVNQGAKTFTVTDASAVLSGATGTFSVVGSTGNNATYTIASAVSGAGSTVITVVEAIPDSTADGWVKRP